MATQPASSPPSATTDRAERTEADTAGEVRRLLAAMSPEEKLALLSGRAPTPGAWWRLATDYNRRPILAGGCERAGLEPLAFSDGPRGVVLEEATCFPVALARGATWDPALEERVGEAMGAEARALGANLFAGVCVNLLRHPGWGRAQETFGEDPHLVGEMGRASVRGLQQHVMACVKHFAVNSIENSRFYVDVEIDDRPLHELYLPHFRRIVEDGVAVVMSAYNRVNGTFCGHSKALLGDILRDLWGFRGPVISDFVLGVRDGVAALGAGVDVEMPFRWRFSALPRALADGRLAPQAVEAAAARVVRALLEQRRRHPGRHYPRELVAGPEHRALARECARRSMVLLRNEAPPAHAHRVLPLDAARDRRIALLGVRAERPSLGDHGSSRVRPPHVVTPARAIAEAAADRGLVLAIDGGNDLDSAIAVARDADVAIVVVGYTSRDEGEFLGWQGGDRASLELRRHDRELIRRVSAANPRTVVVLGVGSPVLTRSWDATVPAILVSWYAGMEGGHALADLLFGDAEPTGRLSATWPETPADLPAFQRWARRVRYDFHHGYRKLDRDGRRAAWPFGFGLGYASFDVAAPRIARRRLSPADTLEVRVALRNTSRRRGSELVQLYVGPRPAAPGALAALRRRGPAPHDAVTAWAAAVERPVRELRAFARVELDPGRRGEAVLRVAVDDLRVWDPARREFVVAPGAYRAWTGTSSAERDLAFVDFELSAH